MLVIMYGLLRLLRARTGVCKQPIVELGSVAVSEHAIGCELLVITACIVERLLLDTGRCLPACAGRCIPYRR